MKKDPLKLSGMHDGATPKVFRNAEKLRDSMTEPEIKVWSYLKTKPQGFKFRRQHPIAGYVLDFYGHKLRLAIEIDGGYHLKAEQREKDVERLQYLSSVGITEMRFRNYEVDTNFENVIEKINEKLSVGIPLGIEGSAKATSNNHD